MFLETLQDNLNIWRQEREETPIPSSWNMFLLLIPRWEGWCLHIDTGEGVGEIVTWVYKVRFEWHVCCGVELVLRSPWNQDTQVRYFSLLLGSSAIERSCASKCCSKARKSKFSKITRISKHKSRNSRFLRYLPAATSNIMMSVVPLSSPFLTNINNNKRSRSNTFATNTNKRIKSSSADEKNTDYWSNYTSYAIAVVDTNTFINSIDKINNLKFYNNMQVVVPMIGTFLYSDSTWPFKWTAWLSTTNNTWQSLVLSITYPIPAIIYRDLVYKLWPRLTFYIEKPIEITSLS